MMASSSLLPDLSSNDLGLSDAVLLITSHPDDEAMFFFPTIHTLRKNLTPVYILCLSNGNFDNLGSIREVEMRDAAVALGLNLKNVEVLNDERLQDGPNSIWDSDVVAHHIVKSLKFVGNDHKSCQGLRSNENEMNSSTKDKKEKIVNNRFEDRPSASDCISIVTFDSMGVSGHPNHIDTWKGVKEFLKENDQNGLNLVKAFELHSIKNIFRKYIPPLDWILLLFYFFFLKTSRKMQPVIIMTSFDPLNAWRVMATHTSQFVWYRRLSVLFSRYTYVNTLSEIILDDVGKEKQQ